MESHSSPLARLYCPVRRPSSTKPDLRYRAIAAVLCANTDPRTTMGLHQYPQWESDSSGHGWPEELGTLASSLGLLVELVEGLGSSAGVGACLSAASS